MLDIAQAHHSVGQQFQRPALPPIGSLATREMDQLGFSFAIQAAPFARGASGESYFQVLLHKALLDTNHGATTDGEHLGNLPIGVAGPALTLIAHQEDTGDQVVFSRGAAGMDHHFQKVSLSGLELHRIANRRDAHSFLPSIGCSVSELSQRGNALIPALGQKYMPFRDQQIGR
jgi:hypothetical protein